MASEKTDSPERTYLCVLEYVWEGMMLVGQVLLWPARSPALAAQQAARLELAPGCKYHRIVVVPLSESESFRWLGSGQVQSERVN